MSRLDILFLVSELWLIGLVGALTFALVAP
jgi:hypothetical protein